MFWINWVVKQTPLCSFCPSFKRTTKAQSTEMSCSLWARKWVKLGASTWMAALAHLWMMDTFKLTVRGPVASHSVCVQLSLRRRCRCLVSFVFGIWIQCVVSSFMISNWSVIGISVQTFSCRCRSYPTGRRRAERNCSPFGAPCCGWGRTEPEEEPFDLHLWCKSHLQFRIQ